MQQNPMSLIQFQKKFATEKACQQHLFRMRWPAGYKCPLEKYGRWGKVIHVTVENRDKIPNLVIPLLSKCLDSKKLGNV